MTKTRKLQMLKSLVFLTLAAIVATASLIPFTIQANEIPVDQPSSWAAAYVDRADVLGLLPEAFRSGFSQATTRAEFASLAVTLYEHMGAPVLGRTTFTDTTDSFVERAAYLGIVTGVGGGRFDPDSSITREQAAVMLSRLAGAQCRNLAASNSAFADNAQVSAWAVSAVGEASAAGLMGGTGNNMFSPSADYTKEQSIVTIVRLYDLVGEAAPSEDEESSETGQSGSVMDSSGGVAMAEGALTFELQRVTRDGVQIPDHVIARIDAVGRAMIQVEHAGNWQWLPRYWTDLIWSVDGILISWHVDLDIAPDHRQPMYLLNFLDSGGIPRSATILQNRVQTSIERDVWIAEYDAMGGPSEFERAVLEEVNRVRVEHGLNMLIWDYDLGMASRFYTQILVDLDYDAVGHGGSNPAAHNFGPYGGSNGVARSFGVTDRRGANGAWGTRTPARVVQGWMSSPHGHRENVLRSGVTAAGVGAAIGGPRQWNAVYYFMIR